MKTAVNTAANSSVVDTSVPAVVLKFDQNLLHHGGLGAIRSLGRAGVPVYGVHEQRLAPAAASRYLRGRWYWRPGTADGALDAEQVHADLLALSARIGRRAVLIPTDDAASIFLAEHGDPLRDAFLFPAPPADLPRRLAGKFSMFQLCRDLGVATPEAALPSTAEECETFADTVGYPLIGKLSAPWRHGGKKLRSTSILTDRNDLIQTFWRCAESGVGLMLQEFIPGGPGQDWFFHGYCDRDSVCRPAFTGVKERSYPAHAGLTSLGRSQPNLALRGQLTRLLKRIGYRGIVDLDLRFDWRDGEYKLLDFNPRLGAQFRLFRDAAGVDVVLAQYLDLTGQSIPDSVQVANRIFLVENYDPIAAVSYWRRGELGLGSWLGSLRGTSETAWFARDDLRPFGLMCLRMGWRAMSRPLRGDPKFDPTTDRALPRFRPGRTKEKVA